jgi:signal transduction histidine kinase
VLGGWSQLPGQDWIIVVEQPVREALAPTNQAMVALLVALFVALVLSLTVGYQYSQRVLASLEVEERWRTAGRIAAGISHDLGHRLAILRQTAALAEVADPIYLPIIRDNLKTEVATLRRFVTDFADLSREVKETELVALDMNAFAESVRRSGMVYAEQLGVRLVTELLPEAPWVLADRYLLERAVLNLITNAIEASPGGQTVTLRVLLDSKAKHVRFEVQDRGPGIAPERQKEIFNAFLSTKRTGAHVGLGLANVHRIVRALGGVASLKSQLGRGATFCIALPLVPRPD